MSRKSLLNVAVPPTSETVTVSSAAGAGVTTTRTASGVPAASEMDVSVVKNVTVGVVLPPLTVNPAGSAGASAGSFTPVQLVGVPMAARSSARLPATMPVYTWLSNSTSATAVSPSVSPAGSADVLELVASLCHAAPSLLTA